MSRLSDRVSEKLLQITCPGCHERVLPVGESCPECNFPINRFRIRKKWFTTLFIGVLIGMGALVLTLGGLHLGLVGWTGITILALWIIAGATILTGAIGLVFGGRHTSGQRRQSSGWTAPTE